MIPLPLKFVKTKSLKKKWKKNSHIHIFGENNYRKA